MIRPIKQDGAVVGATMNVRLDGSFALVELIGELLHPIDTEVNGVRIMITPKPHPAPPTRPPETSTAEPDRDFWNPEQRHAADEHAAVCNTCERKRRITPYTVKCQDCGCAGINLLSGRCPLGKWGTSEA